MDIVSSFARRARHYIAVFGSLLALVLATLVPGLASAAQLTERSIAVSSSSANATNVTYDIKFTAATTASAVGLEFCTNSSLSNDTTCTAPSGLDLSTAAIGAKGGTAVAASDTPLNNTTTITDAITAGSNVEIELTGIHNPTSAGVVYARILTFDTVAHATAYTAGADPTTSGLLDAGGVALDYTNSFGVSAAVLESMSFCVSKVAISANCTGTTVPTLTLGKTVGTTTALDSTEVSTDTMYTQINTNALHGAIISLKSSATNCGGLELAGDTNTSDCFIAPAQNTDIAANQAKFGVKTATATGGSDTLEPVTGSYYSNTAYGLKAATDNSVGVTSTYGDPFLDTAGAKANNMNMELTFGASTNASVPAGNYSADLSLIATGTF